MKGTRVEAGLRDMQNRRDNAGLWGIAVVSSTHGEESAWLGLGGSTQLCLED